MKRVGKITEMLGRGTETRKGKQGGETEETRGVGKGEKSGLGWRVKQEDRGKRRFRNGEARSGTEMVRRCCWASGNRLLILWTITAQAFLGRGEDGAGTGSSGKRPKTRRRKDTVGCATLEEGNTHMHTDER